MADTHPVDETHYRADLSDPPADRATAALSRFGVWLIVAVIAIAIVAAGIYLFPHPHPLTITPGQPQFTLPVPAASHSA